MLKNKLKECRMRSHLTQTELAVKSGVSRNTISKIENNEEITVSTKTIAKLAEALSANPSDIFLF